METDKKYLDKLEKYHRQRDKIKKLLTIIDEKRNLIFQEPEKSHT